MRIFFTCNLLGLDCHQLILTSLYHNSRDTHFKNFLPRQKFHLLLLKTQFRQRRFLLAHGTEKFMDSTPTNFHSFKHPLLHYFTTFYHQPLWEIRKLHTKSFGSSTACSERFLNMTSQLSQSSNHTVFHIPSIQGSQPRHNVCLYTGYTNVIGSLTAFFLNKPYFKVTKTRQAM